jgi:hypothetical protein
VEEADMDIQEEVDDGDEGVVVEEGEEAMHRIAHEPIMWERYWRAVAARRNGEQRASKCEKHEQSRLSCSRHSSHE